MLRRIFLPLTLGLLLLVAVLLMPALHQQLTPKPAHAGTTTTVRYVANNGLDADTCTNPDAPCRTIQHAVDSANAGDEIWVAAGVYTDVHTRNTLTQMVYVDKPLTIRGGFEEGWERHEIERYDESSGPITVLDARAQGRVFVISGPTRSKAAPATVTDTVLLERLDLVGGDALGQGGDPSSESVDAGGAIYATGGTVKLVDVFIGMNRANIGGGATFAGSRVYLQRTTFHSNTADYDRGGGIFLHESPDAIIIESSFEKNVSMGAGGGLNAKHSKLWMGRTRFVHNEAYEGAGLSVYSSTFRMKRNYVFSNTASNAGGGVQLWQVADAVLDNNAIVENHAGTVGAGIDVYDAEARLRHNTIANNTGNNGGTGLNVSSAFYSSTVAVTNTLIAGHEHGVNVDGGGTFVGDATLWWNGNDRSGSGTFITSTNDVYAGPRFRTAAHDYRLRPFSPAVDAGVPAGLHADFEGDRRPYGGAPDIGADEVPYGFATPEGGWNFVYTDTEGISMTMDVPADGVVTDTRIVFSRRVTPGQEVTDSLRFAGVAFDLDAYLDRLGNEEPEEDFRFQKPVTLTLRYHDEDVADIDEDTLKLYFWTGSEWKDIAEDCGTTYKRYLEINVLRVPICHLSQYGLLGQYGLLNQGGEDVYLPIIQ